MPGVRRVSTPAKITTERGLPMWRCPNCGQKLAEILGDRVVIKAGTRTISLPVGVEQDQVCWRCGTMSALKRECVA